MQNPVFRSLCATLALGISLVALPAHAAPKQLVIVIAEGASPQLLDLGRSYLRVASDEPELASAFDNLKSANPLTGADSLANVANLLAGATKNGFKTGLVTTGDILAEASLFHHIPESSQTQIPLEENPQFDFLAGGGRTHFGAGMGAKLSARGDTYFDSVAGLDEEIRGRVMTAQADNDLDFALDRDPSQQAGLSELATLALDTLGSTNAPFVLVIHDTLIKKALDTRDTPALLGEFRELDALLTEILARRTENLDLQLAVCLTGSSATPRFTAVNEAEQRSALRTAASFSLSYAGAGRALQSADDAEIDDFIDARDGQYPGLQLSPETRELIRAGTLDAQEAVRAASEPLLKISYNGPAAAPIGLTLGLAPGDLLAALRNAVAAPEK